jgi:hypothetical protein
LISLAGVALGFLVYMLAAALGITALRCRKMDNLLGGAAEHSYIHVADLRAAAYGSAGSSRERRYAV